MGYILTRKAHLGLYSRIDIALDTFPYNGTTTTCEALYMGAPVITLTGDTHRNRVGESLLKALGKTAWIANSRDQYMAIATTLAADAGKLATTRNQLRERLGASPLCDRETFAQNVESAYRAMWRDWCNAHT